jgi:hypothetical protein
MRNVFHSALFFTFTLSGGTIGKIEPIDSGFGVASTCWKMLIFIPQ